MISVCHVRKQNEFFYIGRRWAEFEESPFHNPFHIGKDGDRKEVLLKFTVYWYAPAQAWLRLLALRTVLSDTKLGCWCHPQTCHGDIISGYLNWKRRPRSLFEEVPEPAKLI
jgi:hypothetical protein